jgi:hypothetical protein
MAYVITGFKINFHYHIIKIQINILKIYWYFLTMKI